MKPVDAGNGPDYEANNRRSYGRGFPGICMAQVKGFARHRPSAWFMKSLCVQERPLLNNGQSGSYAGVLDNFPIADNPV